MSKLISIDPGKYKCGFVLAEISERKVCKAINIKSEYNKNFNGKRTIFFTGQSTNLNNLLNICFLV